MRRTWTWTLLLGLALASPPARAQDVTAGPKAIFPYPIRRTVLDNGLTVLSVPYDSPGIIAYYTVVRTGSRNEVEAGLTGFAHFFEHMMFRGTERYSQEAYNAELKKLGADSNAFTADDWTCYHITVAASALEKVVELESDRFRNLKYDEAGFQKEARAVLGEYNKSASSPFLILFEALQGTAYTAHTYRHTTLGFLDDIKAMPNQYGYSLVFFKRWYRPDNCTIVVAGDVDHDQLVNLCKQYYGGWKAGTAQIAIPAEPPQREERTKALTWPTETLPTVVLGYHIPAADPGNPDTAALQALAQAVFGETSPLYKQLVLDEQKVVVIEAEAESKRDPGLFVVLTRVRSPGEMAEVQRRILDALADAARTPVDPARLAAIKAHLKYAFAGALDSPDAIANAVGASIAATGRPDSMNALYAAFDRLTPDDLRRVAAAYFAPQNRTIVTLVAQPKEEKAR